MWSLFGCLERQRPAFRAAQSLRHSQLLLQRMPHETKEQMQQSSLLMVRATLKTPMQVPSQRLKAPRSKRGHHVLLHQRLVIRNATGHLLLSTNQMMAARYARKSARPAYPLIPRSCAQRRLMHGFCRINTCVTSRAVSLAAIFYEVHQTKKYLTIFRPWMSHSCLHLHIRLIQMVRLRCLHGRRIHAAHLHCTCGLNVWICTRLSF